MSQKMEKQLKQFAERCGDDFCYDITYEAFNLIVTATMKSKAVNEMDKAILVRQFSTELISVGAIINTILNAE